MANIYSKLEKLAKSLPIVKSIPGFNSLPDKITSYNLRFYKLCNLVNTLGMFVHALWVVLFLYLENYLAVYINIFSVAIYIFNIVINRRGYHLTSAVIMVCEIIGHQWFAVNFFGWNAGFQYYIIVIALYPFLMPQGNWILKSLLLTVCLLSYILMDFVLKNGEPYYIIPSNFLTFFGISNIIFSFTSMSISGGYFNIAMHETEAELAKRTEELVEAEQRATLGRIATEMAHEIQNPLNFVNNFAALNEELLQELKEDLAKTKLNDDTKLILEDLLKNSEKIKTNGKRVSYIVDLLQEQVKKS